MTSGAKPAPASCHALILFGLLLTATSLDRVWRSYSDTDAIGWDTLGGSETLVNVVFVVVVAIVIWDALMPRSAQPWPARVAATVLGVALLACLVAVVVAVNNEAPAVFDGHPADDHPRGGAYAALGGVAAMLIGWAGLLRASRRD
ncbi:MAG TPA: hypothetical protein VFY99_03445 [Solirubrobacterales bacterium]